MNQASPTFFIQIPGAPCDSRSLGIAARLSRRAVIQNRNKLESLLSKVRSGGSRKEEFSW
jgi:hypothetical protein